MTRATRTRSLLASAAGLAAAFAAGCAIDISSGEYVARERKAFPIAPGTPASVELVTYDGRIEVRGWDRSEVSVEIERGGRSKELVDAIAVAATQTGGTIRIEAKSPEGDLWVSDLMRASHHVNLIASVPRECALRVRSGDGGIRVERVDGRLDVETADGAVRGIALTGDVRVRSGDGSIKLESVDGLVSADTGDGSIFLGGRLRGVVATSGDGSIAIRLDAGSVPDRDWQVTTHDGGIALELPEAFDATIDASTGDGVVRAERALGLPTDRHPANTLRGTLGSGAHLVKIRSGDGSISLRRQ